MRPFPSGAFLAELEPLVRSVIRSEGLEELGIRGKFIYLVRDEITESLLQVHEILLQTVRSRGHTQEVIAVHESLCGCLRKFQSGTLIRCGIWWDGIRYELYLDETARCIVHQATIIHPDPDLRDAREAPHDE